MNEWIIRRLAAITAVVITVAILLLVFWQPSPEKITDSVHSLPADQKIWNLRLGHNMPVDSAMHDAALTYAKIVEEKSGGRVQITLYPNQQLGDDHKMVEMARRGTLDIILTPTAKMGVALPSMQYVDLPFYFPARDDLYRMLDGEPGHILLDELSQIGLIGVTFWENGFKHFTANTPLYHPDDFKGKKFRIMKSRLIQSQFDALGAKTLPIDFHETRKALADGVVEGQENPLIAIKSMAIHEVQKHLTLSSHGYMGYVFCISAKTYKGLPSDLQRLLYDSARDLTPYERQETHKREAQLLSEMERSGLKIHRLDEKSRLEFTRLMSPIASQYEEVIGTHLLSITEELLLDAYGLSPQSGKQIAIGLNADLSMNSKAAGLAIKRGAQLAIDEINAEGGVLGKPLILIAKDHRAISGKSINNMKAFIDRDDVVAIIGGVQSSVIYPSIVPAQKAGIPYLIPWASAAELTDVQTGNNVVFRVSANDRDAIAFLSHYLLKRYRHPAILYENSLWGRNAYIRMNKILAAKSRPFALAMPFNVSQQNFSAEAARLQHSKPDALVLISSSLEAASIVNTLYKHKIKLPIVSHMGITNNNFFVMTKEALRHSDLRFLQTFSFLDSPTPRSRALARHYLQRYAVPSPESILAPAGVAQTYDLVHLLARAIKKAGSTDRAAVRDALEYLGPYDGAVRYYTRPFTPERHDALTPENYRMAHYRSDGVIVTERHAE